MPDPTDNTPSRLSPDQWQEAATFIQANLPLTEVPGTGLRLHLAGPRSGLARLVAPGGTPYWAHAWPGGVALAMHLRAHPDTVRGRIVADVGTGSGLVAIAAMKAGAAGVYATDPDPLAQVAAPLNARANDVSGFPVMLATSGKRTFSPVQQRRTRREAILAGDVFYDEELAGFTTAALDAVQASFALDTPILIGDIGRRFLPRDRLEPLASYSVRDVGDPPSAPLREGWVFRWKPRA